MAEQLPQNLLTQSPFIDPEQQQALTELQRKQQLANLLSQRGMETPQGQMVSGHYVKPSWTQQLAPLVGALVGERTNEQLDKQQKEYENWDSFAHLHILTLAEEKFQISLTVDESTSVDSAKKLLDCVRAHI